MKLEVLESVPMLKRFIHRMLLVFVVGVVLSSCAPMSEDSFIEVESSDYLLAKQRMREGDVEGALESFAKVIDKYPYAPESHLETGVIYLRNEDEPVLAIYHFQKYLQLKPDSREASLVEELILSAKKQFATSLPGNPFKDAVSRMELLETIAVLKRKTEGLSLKVIELESENQRLEQKLSGTQNTMREIFAGEPGSVADENGAVADAANGVRSQPLVMSEQTERQVQELLPQAVQTTRVPETYQVKPGDSLYAISMNVYGDAEHIQAIFQANRNILKSVNDLRPGQVLRLPR